jgi:hypothetical protein
VHALTTFVGVVGAVASLLAAALWFYASVLEVPDNIDTIVNELQRISRWNAAAAVAAGVGAVCAAHAFVRSLLRSAPAVKREGEEDWRR